jgi:hypothetical protein
MNNQSSSANDFLDVALGTETRSKSATTSSEDKNARTNEFLDYAINEPEAKPVKGSWNEFIAQLSKEAYKRGGGDIGSAWEWLHQIQKEPGARYSGEPETTKPFISIPESPLPTVQSLGESVGYEEPTTMAGRYGKRIGGNIGAAAPFMAVNPVLAAPLALSGVIGGILGQTVEELGGPEWMATGADILGGIGTMAGKVGKVATKPSGITTRAYETLEKTKKITPEAYESLVGKIGEEARDVKDKMFTGNKTYKAIKEDPVKFKQELDNGLNRVGTLFENHPATINGKRLKSNITLRKNQYKIAPITLGDRDKAFINKIDEISSTIKNRKKYSVGDFFKQYRSNNKQIGELLNMTESKGANAGKLDALLEYNRGIAEEINNRIPITQVNELFKTTNKTYSDAANIKKIETYMNDVFTDKKINYDKALGYFDDKELQRSVNSTFGDKKEKEFKQLMTDVVSQKKGMGKLKVVEGTRGHLLDPRTYISQARSILYTRPKLEKGIGKKAGQPAIVGISQLPAKGEEKRGPSLEELLSR